MDEIKVSFKIVVLDGPPKNHVNKKNLIKCPQPVLKKSPVRKKTKELLKKTPPVQKAVKRKIQVVKEEVPATQPEPVMCIKWNTYLSNMTSALPDLMNDEQFVDVTLACEGQSLKCHKVLSTACVTMTSVNSRKLCCIRGVAIK